MKTRLALSVCAAVACAATVHANSDAERALEARLPAVMSAAADHYRALDAAATPLMKGADGSLRYPHGLTADRSRLRMNPVRAWTSGHFAGSLWYLYEATGDAFFKDRAQAWTDILATNATIDTNHDVGFIMYCSYGNARRLLKTDRFDALLAETAESLSRRFNPAIGLIRSWGRIGDDKDFLVIPDNMMNLELLEAVSKITGNAKYAKIARSHADATMRNHFRQDGGCYHVLNYDTRPGFEGSVKEIRRGQGLGCGSAWSRGQSWAIYGYTMMFRETGDRRYLDFARKVADYAMLHPNMPEDCVPYWDYGAPGEERDSSAAAVMASGLIELSTFLPDGAKYRAFAVKQLVSLSSPAYFSEGGENSHFLLKHGVGSKPSGSEVDFPLNYGDYYFLEALLRFKALRAAPASGVARVDAKHLPERMDDFLWENGFAAFRAYGPKLARPKPEGQGFSSNGIDVFCKGVSGICGAETILAGVKNRVSYHRNDGRCFDSYTVGPGCGCGGIARRDASGAWRRDGNWKAQRVVELTGDRAVFELEYDTCVLRGTVTADSPFVRFDATPKGAQSGGLWGPGLDIAAERGHGGVQYVDAARGIVANAEEASGTMTAIVVDPSAGAVRVASDDTGSLVLLVPEGPFTYYAAAAWRGMGVFPGPEAWFARVRDFAGKNF